MLFWTTERVAILQREYLAGGAKRAAQVLGVSQGAVYNAAALHGIVRFGRKGTKEAKSLQQAYGERCPDCGAKLTLKPCLECQIDKNKRIQRAVAAMTP